jgi:xanthine dehydrogenase accessory factor
MKNKKDYNELLKFFKKPIVYFLLIATENKNDFIVGDKILLDEKANIIFSSNGKKYDINVKDFPYNKIGIITVEIGEEEYQFYLEKFSPNERIIIFGAGHIGTLLTEMLQFFNFKVITVDDRKDLLDEIDDKKSDKLWIDFNEINSKLTITEHDYLIIVTRGHLYDKDVLEQVINSDAKYIGMIGSKKRVFAVKKLLLEEGYKQEKLDKLFAPIGIPFSSNAVEEIALSIIAEIIAVKNNKSKIIHSRG